MKVLDPQSALLTTSEIQQFLVENPVRPPARQIGSHPTVNLTGYSRVRADFQYYTSTIVPRVIKISPEPFLRNVVPRLRTLGLTKTEVYTLINLGVGLPKAPAKQQMVNGNGHVDGASLGEDEEAIEHDEFGAAADEGDEEPAADADAFENSDYLLVPCIIEEFNERFPDEDEQQHVQKILDTIREEYVRAQELHVATNGDVGVDIDGDNHLMDVS